MIRQYRRGFSRSNFKPEVIVSAVRTRRVSADEIPMTITPARVVDFVDVDGDKPTRRVLGWQVSAQSGFLLATVIPTDDGTTFLDTNVLRAILSVPGGEPPENTPEPVMTVNRNVSFIEGLSLQFEATGLEKGSDGWNLPGLLEAEILYWLKNPHLPPGVVITFCPPLSRIDSAWVSRIANRLRKSPGQKALTASRKVSFLEGLSLQFEATGLEKGSDWWHLPGLLEAEILSWMENPRFPPFVVVTSRPPFSSMDSAWVSRIADRLRRC